MKILVAEDNPVFQNMLKRLLAQWDYQVIVTDNGDQAWQILQDPNGPRLALLDWMMPGMDGVEICHKLRATIRERYVYVLLLTAKTEQKDLVEGMEAGADDYLTKPFKTHELRVRLRAGRRILDLEQELRLAKDALHEQATHDGLTGLWNRTSILDTLHKEIARSAREFTFLSVLMADLDHFKQINDTYGHFAGDAVLRESAQRMTANIRRYDALGRYGGEEFLVVLPGCDEAGSLAQAERLRECISDHPFAVAADNLRVTCSLGACCTYAPDLTQTDTLLRFADEALYQAKRAGRNRVQANCHAVQPA
jgi:diguanylate cyclase (GGDEF)-like protein